MDLDDLGSFLDGLDDTSISDALAFLGDNKERILDAVEFINEHKEGLGALLVRLPSLLSDTGEGLTAAGEGAAKAGALITGDGGDGGVRELGEMAAGALDACLDQLGRAVDVLQGLGDKLDRVRIPTIEPEFTEVAGFRVISGLDIGEAGLVDDLGQQLAAGAESLEAIGRELGSVATGVRTLTAQIGSAGDGISEVGVKLQDSGVALSALDGLGSSAQGGRRGGRGDGTSRKVVPPKPAKSTAGTAPAKSSKSAASTRSKRSSRTKGGGSKKSGR